LISHQIWWRLIDKLNIVIVENKALITASESDLIAISISDSFRSKLSTIWAMSYIMANTLHISAEYRWRYSNVTDDMKLSSASILS